MLRDNRDLIPAFIEESLRMQSPTKVDFRLARKTTSLGRRAHPGRHRADALPRCGQP